MGEAQSRAERRWSRQAAKDRARRQVRTSSGRPRSTRPVTIQIGGSRKRKGRRGKPSLALALWSILTSLVSLVAVITQSLVAIIAAATLLGATVAVARIEARTARATGPRPPRKSANPRGSRPNPRSSGTAATNRRQARGSTGRKPVCSDACQVSTRPKSTCRCKAADCRHGSRAGAAK